MKQYVKQMHIQVNQIKGSPNLQRDALWHQIHRDNTISRFHVNELGQFFTIQMTKVEGVVRKWKQGRSSSVACVLAC